MKRLYLILSSLALSCMFMVFSPTYQMGFLFSDVVMPAENWFYYLFEHVILIVLALAIVSEATEYRFALWTFVVIEVLDTLDYALFYGEPWIKNMPPWVKIFPTWNLFKMGIFVMAILYERKK